MSLTMTSTTHSMASSATASVPSGSNNPSRLPSPPVSPDRVKTTRDTAEQEENCGNSKEGATAIQQSNKPEKSEHTKFSGFMTVLPHRNGHIRADSIAFLKSYQAIMGAQSHHGNKRKYAPRVVKPVHNTVPSRSRVYNSEEECTNATSSQDSSSNYIVSTSRTYVTRSRKGAVLSQTHDTISAVKASSSRAVPRTFSGVSKADFLKACDVHMIHDIEIKELPDFAPSMEHITPAQVEKQIRRIGFSLNHALKDTAHLEEVPESEIALLSAFKLTPLQYLDNKKRFFAEKARKTHVGSTFKKTDAQKACAIDVNKASKLYEVFDHMGLLRDSLFGGH